MFIRQVTDNNGQEKLEFQWLDKNGKLNSQCAALSRRQQTAVATSMSSPEQGSQRRGTMRHTMGKEHAEEETQQRTMF